MMKLRVDVVVLLLWLAGLYNIERIHEPINLASFVYVLVGVLAAAIVLTPRLRKATLIELTLVSLPVYALLKWALGYSFLGQQLPITVTECVVLCVTSALSWRVAHRLDEFMRSAADMTAVRLYDQMLTFDEGEPRMYSEVQRARRFQRQLTLASVAFRGECKEKAAMERLTQQARLEIVRRYLESRVAKQLLQFTSPGDLIVNRKGEFILMFPEATGESLRPMLQQAAEELRADLGLQIQIGIAEFPNEECTLAGLIERAESAMRILEWKSQDASSDRGQSVSPVALDHATA